MFQSLEIDSVCLTSIKLNSDSSRKLYFDASVQYGCAEVWMTILESGWNLWVWLVGVVSRSWVWLVGGIYGHGYNV